MSIYCYQKPDKSVVHWRFDKEQLDKECLLNEIDVSECCLIEASEEPKEAYDGRFYLMADLPEMPSDKKNQRQKEKRRNLYQKMTDELVIEYIRKKMTGILSTEEEIFLEHRISILSAEIQEKNPLF